MKTYIEIERLLPVRLTLVLFVCLFSSLASFAQGPPVGVAAAGDSLWLLNPAKPDSLYQRPSFPLDVPVRDMAFQVNVRPPLYFQDARLVGATPRGIFIWTPISETLVWAELGNIEAVEASADVWALLERDEEKRGRLRFAQTSQTHDLVDPQSWALASDDIPEVYSLELTDIPTAWLTEVAPKEKTWADITDVTSTHIGFLCPREENSLRMATPEPHASAASYGLPAVEEKKSPPLSLRQVMPFQRLIAILESSAQGRMQIRFLGSDYGGEPIWESEAPFHAVAAAGTPPQGGLATWIVASEDSLLLLQVPIPRRLRAGESVTIKDERKLPGTLSALCTDDTRWAAVAYEEDGRTTVEIINVIAWSLEAVASCRIDGRVDALAVIPLESFRQ